MTSKILVFAGSVRSGSINVKLAHVLASALKQRGAEVNHITLADYELPLFNGDIDIPDNAAALAELIASSDGLVVVSPEYNASLTPLLKNTLDWISVVRQAGNEGFGPYKDKVCFIAACSPGAVGGLRGLYHLRAVLMNVGAEIMTPQLAVGNGATAFDENARLSEERLNDLMNKGLDDFVLKIRQGQAVPDTLGK